MYDRFLENGVIVFPGPADYNPTHPRLSKPIEPAPGEVKSSPVQLHFFAYIFLPPKNA